MSATATELAAQIRQREVSPVEVVDACIERIEAQNPSLNAFVYLGFDDARQRAREAEQAVANGDELGPLHGVPTAIKDLFDFKPGWVSTLGGIRALKDFRVDFYCSFAEKIERAGAIIIGKTNSPTMGFRGTCDNFLFGPSRNPFDTSRNTGGSSGGSGAAVAAGLVPFAEGTDGGGSIRIPAAWCGVYGYKASFGRTPMIIRPNAFGAVAPFLHEGPLARTVEDAAIAVDALAGYDPRDPFAVLEETSFVDATRRSISGMRIAYSPNFDVFPVDRRVAEVVADAVKAFEDAGASVEEVRVGIEHDQRELSDLWCRMIMAPSISTLENFKRNGLDLVGDHREDFPPQYLDWLEKGYRMTPVDLARDQWLRTEIYEAVQHVLDDYDLLVTPTLAALPVENTDDGNTMGPETVEGVEVDRLIGWCLTYLINFTGHPAASIPAGLADGLPVGLQIIGRRWGDADVFAASGAFEQARPWHQTYELCEAAHA